MDFDRSTTVELLLVSAESDSSHTAVESSPTNTRPVSDESDSSPFIVESDLSTTVELPRFR